MFFFTYLQGLHSAHISIFVKYGLKFCDLHLYVLERSSNRKLDLFLLSHFYKFALMNYTYYCIYLHWLVVVRLYTHFVELL